MKGGYVVEVGENIIENSVLLTNIQRFSLHDGPGIRTTVFLKGCSLRCPWCSNPENLSGVPQSYTKDGLNGVYGEYMAQDALAEICLKDKGFYGEKSGSWDIKNAGEISSLPGGVTFSGGECLLQMERLIPVCEALHREGVHIAAETCLFIPAVQLAQAVCHIDLFYVDVKILDPERCRQVEHGDLELYLHNLDVLLHSGRPVVIRIPVIGGQTDNGENRKAVLDLLKKYGKQIIKVELIREHNLGEPKYISLGMPVPEYKGVGDELLKKYRAEIVTLGIPVEICSV